MVRLAAGRGERSCGARRRVGGGGDASQGKRRAILDAARRLFSEQGFDRVNMDAIAACADASKATVYAYFGNKERLFRAALDELLGEAPDPWTRLPTLRGALPERLAAVADAILSVATAPALRGVHRMLALSRQFPVQPSDLYWDLCFARYDRAMQALLVREAAREALAVADPARASQQFFGLVAGAPMARALLIGEPFATSAARTAHVEGAVALFLCAYRPPRRGRRIGRRWPDM
ncbi:TetR/AcrR family transcriptional regulator [Xanthomonas sp. AmX2]|uniref:TetR family transcriptional regulator n=1 Tax=Xanthomonas sp. TaxID=29446 RepID=UPI00197F8218|nr:TetR/AcrR family transcriptional regulator [Xanthomonas sp.]